MEKKVSIDLPIDELIVLSDLFYRINSNGVLNSFFQDKSEQIAMLQLESYIEKANNFDLAGNYKNILIKARENLKSRKS